MDSRVEASERSRGTVAEGIRGTPSTPMVRAECLARLALEPIGRLIVPRPDRPALVVPAVYLLRGDTLLLRTAQHLPTPRDRQRVVFEVDRIDVDRRQGWSVMV